MRKSRLSNGTPIIEIKVDHSVDAHFFAKHLTESFIEDDSDKFDVKLTKRKALSILKKRLFFHGLCGAIDTSLYHGSSHGLDTYNEIYSMAIEWVNKNYPYLNHK